MLTSKSSVIAVAFIGFALSGCVTNEAIVAGAVDTVGVSVAGGATEQGGNVVVGFKGAKFAVVPVQTEAGHLLATRDGAGKVRGYSVLALLGIDVAGGVATGAGINQVVAVGKPADIWALGQAKNKP